MQIAKVWGSEPQNHRTDWQKKLAWVITSAITPHTPKLKTIAPLGAWRHMREISPSRAFSARCNIYISRLCYDVSVHLSVRLSVTEVRWHIIANKVSNSDPTLPHIAAAVLLAVLLSCGLSRAMLASARSLVSFPIVSYSILSFFVTTNFSRVLRINHRTNFYAVCFIWREFWAIA